MIHDPIGLAYDLYLLSLALGMIVDLMIVK